MKIALYKKKFTFNSKGNNVWTKDNLRKWWFMKGFFSMYTLKRLKEVNKTTKIPQRKKKKERNSNFCLVTDLLAVPGVLPVAVTRGRPHSSHGQGSRERWAGPSTCSLCSILLVQEAAPACFLPGSQMLGSHSFPLKGEPLVTRVDLPPVSKLSHTVPLDLPS